MDRMDIAALMSRATTGGLRIVKRDISALLNPDPDPYLPR